MKDKDENLKRDAFLAWASDEELILELVSRQNSKYYIIEQTPEGEYVTYQPQEWTVYELIVIHQLLQTGLLGDLRKSLKTKKKPKGEEPE